MTVLLCESELCAAGHRGRYVHAAARAHSGICFDDARRALFRRGFREEGTENRGGKREGAERKKENEDEAGKGGEDEE